MRAFCFSFGNHYNSANGKNSEDICFLEMCFSEIKLTNSLYMYFNGEKHLRHLYFCVILIFKKMYNVLVYKAL